jgi:hypothetical protein
MQRTPDRSQQSQAFANRANFSLNTEMLFDILQSAKNHYAEIR